MKYNDVLLYKLIRPVITIFIRLLYTPKIEGIENIEPMTHCLDDFIYTLREDEAEESIPVEEILQNCDDKTKREVKVPKVVG